MNSINFWSEKMTPNVLYIALDFDGVLHETRMGPTRSHCAEYAAGRMTPNEFLVAVSEENRARFNLNEPYADFLFDRSGLFYSSCFGVPGLQVKLVIATSWRNAMTLDAIKALLPSGLARHVVGVLDRCENDFQEAGLRARLMKKWIAEHAPGAFWLAMDDDESHWDGEFSRLVQTPREGLDVRTCLRLHGICADLAARTSAVQTTFSAAPYCQSEPN